MSTLALTVLERHGYKYIRHLDSGTYGTVIAVRRLRDDIMLAAKVMHPRDTSKGELELWSTLDHKNVLKLVETIKEDGVHIFIMPCHPKNLPEAFLVHKNESHLFDLMCGWVRDIVKAVRYFHGRGLCHLDLKMNNVLTSNDTAIVCDFTSLMECNGKTDRYLLPHRYCPPETWSHLLGHRPEVDGKPFDIWSVGMIIYNIIAKHSLVQLNPDQLKDWTLDIYPVMFQCLQEPLFDELLKNAFPNSEISAERRRLLRNLLKGILRLDPAKRPTAEIVLNHPLLTTEGCGEELEEDSKWPPEKVPSEAVLRKPVEDSQNEISSFDEILRMNHRKVTLQEFLENMREIMEGPDFFPSIERVREALPPTPKIGKQNLACGVELDRQSGKNAADSEDFVANAATFPENKCYKELRQQIDPLSFMLSNPICEAS